MKKPLFLDIETCPEFEHFDDMSLAGQEAYTKKFGNSEEVKLQVKADLAFLKYPTPEEVERAKQTAISYHYGNNAALYPEFSFIVCIGTGVVVNKTADRGPTPKKKSAMPVEEYVHEDKIVTKLIDGEEEDILKRFAEGCDAMGSDLILCAHNGKNFDFPFIIKRMMIKKIRVPYVLRVIGKKPWDIALLDTMEMWRATNYKEYTSLLVLCYVFGVESPKQGITGAEVPAAYRAGRGKEIGEYCVRDVVALANCFLMMVGEDQIDKVVESKK